VTSSFSFTQISLKENFLKPQLHPQEKALGTVFSDQIIQAFGLQKQVRFAALNRKIKDCEAFLRKN
jgi:hypothetical protein